MAKKRPRKWIQSAIKKPGSLTAQAKAAGMSVQAFAQKHKNDPGVTGKRARLALTLMKMSRKKKRKAKR